MELLCCEDDAAEVPTAVQSSNDAVLLTDDRVLLYMLENESLSVTSSLSSSSSSKLVSAQHDEVTPDMRRILTTWMAEVCEDQRCEDVVFPLSTVLLDRVLGCLRVHKYQLQLVGSVCLLIASKLRQCRPLGGELLCYYTDNSISLQELICWEMLVLGKLGWNVSCVTATDFLTPLVSRISCTSTSTSRSNDRGHTNDAAMIRQHAQVFISLCSTESQFSNCKPSLLAVSSLCCAASGLRSHRSEPSVDCTFMSTLQRLTGHRTEDITDCVVQIEELFVSRLSAGAGGVHQNAAVMTASNQKRSAANSHSVGSKSNNSAVQPEDASQPETPTDVQDIHF